METKNKISKTEEKINKIFQYSIAAFLAYAAIDSVFETGLSNYDDLVYPCIAGIFSIYLFLKDLKPIKQLNLNSEEQRTKAANETYYEVYAKTLTREIERDKEREIMEEKKALKRAEAERRNKEAEEGWNSLKEVFGDVRNSINAVSDAIGCVIKPVLGVSWFIIGQTARVVKELTDD